MASPLFATIRAAPPNPSTGGTKLVAERARQRPSQIAHAEFAGTDAKMTSQVFRSLEQKGLIEREVDIADSRARLLRVTRQGARLAPHAVAVVQQVDAEFFEGVPPVDTLQLLRRFAQIPEPNLASST